MRVDDAGIVDMRKENMSNTPTPAEELCPDLLNVADSVDELLDAANKALLPVSLSKENSVRMLVATAHAVGRAEGIKEERSVIRNLWVKARDAGELLPKYTGEKTHLRNLDIHLFSPSADSTGET